MSERTHPELITGIPKHLQSPSAGSETGSESVESPKYNTTFYVKELREGGTALMTPGWKEVFTTHKPDQDGNYWTTLKNPQTGAIAEVPTAELYALQHEIGNPVAPREPLPFNSQVEGVGEQLPEKVEEFVEDAGAAAVERSVQIPVEPEQAPEPSAEKSSPAKIELQKSVDYVRRLLSDADVLGLNMNTAMLANAGLSMIQGFREVVGDDPAMLGQLDAAQRLLETAVSTRKFVGTEKSTLYDLLHQVPSVMSR